MRVRWGLSGGILIMASVAMLAVAGCGKKSRQESAEQPAVSGPAGQGQLPEGHPSVGGAPAGDMAKVAHSSIKSQKGVLLSEEVKAKWKEVKMEITDTSTKSTEVLTLKVGETVPLKKDGFKLRVEAFVPDYAIVEDHIESRSNEPKNPAVLVELMEGDKTTARGWVFKDFPEFNSYNSERIRLTLVSPGSAKPSAVRR
jgi:hypothetical protein